MKKITDLLTGIYNLIFVLVILKVVSLGFGIYGMLKSIG